RALRTPPVSDRGCSPAAGCRSCRSGVGFSARFPDGRFHSGDQLGCGHFQHLRDLDQHHDVWALDAALYHADERPVQARGLRKIFLGHLFVRPVLAQDLPECPLGAQRKNSVRPLPAIQFAQRANDSLSLVLPVFVHKFSYLTWRTIPLGRGRDFQAVLAATPSITLFSNITAVEAAFLHLHILNTPRGPPPTAI